MLIKPTLIFTLIFLLFNSSVIYAESGAQKTPWHSVEYIVFENTSHAGKTPEPWTKNALQIPSNAINLNSSQNKSFKALKSSQLRLHDVAKRLEKLSAYIPIAHGGWAQHLTDRQLKPVTIVQQSGANQLEGTITFHRKKYLHLDINLQLTEQDLPTNYRLQATRRIKADDVHYFDHPRFAVLALVRKLN